MHMRRGITGLVAAATTAASLAGGIAAAKQPAAATTVTSSCSPKTDYEIATSAGTSWHNVCGIGTWNITSVIEVRDASYPLHRIWIHASGGATWCAYGTNDQDVPGYESAYGYNLQVSANTSPC
jgi:hypothetical protein